MVSLIYLNLQFSRGLHSIPPPGLPACLVLLLITAASKKTPPNEMELGPCLQAAAVAAADLHTVATRHQVHKAAQLWLTTQPPHRAPAPYSRGPLGAVLQRADEALQVFQT